jgi:hypothetical protein
LFIRGAASYFFIAEPRLGEKRLQLMGGVKDAGTRIMSLIGGAGSTFSRGKGNHLFPYPADMLMERGCQLS